MAGKALRRVLSLNAARTARYSAHAEEVEVSEANAVFEILRGFRAAAYQLQLWLAGLGLVGLAAAAALLACGRGRWWIFAIGAALLATSAVWALIWRRRIERAFWRGARVPARAEPVRLPQE
jgi:hypothetical protein